MRLIDADKFIEYMTEKADETKDLDNVILAVVCGAISEQPTAYDVERVVEEIKKHSYFMGIRESMVETIVRIVRKGGVE